MQNIRNIAIIAHVDHGKTTVVDKMLMAGHLFRDNQNAGELILDNNDLERERGITILSKNVSINYKGTKINIIDTPGHADFGGEVERVLNMADGCLLLVDAFEGPMPQTRFVLQKALQIGLKPIVVINKVDKPNCRPDEVQEMVFDLMFNLDATEDQLNFPTLFGSAKQGWMSTDWRKPTDNILPLLDAIVKYIPAPQTLEGDAQMLITSLDFSNYVGRIAVGRVHRGTLREGMDIALMRKDGSISRQRIKELHTFEGMGRKRVGEVGSGDICALVGIEGFEIGDTVADINNPEALPRIAIDEPTMSMTFTINDSPFFGRDGKYVTSRHLGDRLTRELDRNLALRVSKAPHEDVWTVYGRGVLHLSVLIETMRREGYEMQVSAPRVIFTHDENGNLLEPCEEVTCEIPQDYMGSVMEKLGARKGELVDMTPIGDRMKLIYRIPTRGLFGYRNEFLTDTRGEGIISSIFDGYVPYKGEIPKRTTGSLIAYETGKATTYGVFNAQDRGQMFIPAAIEVYEGMIVGESPKGDDIVVNVCKKKHLTAIRSAGADEALRLVTPKIFSLEEAIEYINDDELIEVTPKSIRLRKSILSNVERAKVRAKNEKAGN